MMKVYENYFLPFLSLRQAIPLLTFLKLGLPCSGEGGRRRLSSLLLRALLPPPFPFSPPLHCNPPLPFHLPLSFKLCHSPNDIPPLSLLSVFLVLA